MVSLDYIKRFYQFNCDLLAMEAPVICFKKKDMYFDINGNRCKEFHILPSAMATSVIEKNSIYVNLDNIDDEILFFILAHEIRHCYQYQAVIDEDIYEPYSSQWKKEIKSYRNSSSLNYENQEIEIDANAYACFIYLFLGKNIPNVNCDQIKLMKRVKEFGMDFSKEELEDCSYILKPYLSNTLYN